MGVVKKQVRVLQGVGRWCCGRGGVGAAVDNSQLGPHSLSLIRSRICLDLDSLYLQAKTL